jgi:hypothetical protein
MFITIRASEGYILTDGKVYAETISLAENKTASDYREITIEEYEEILKQQENEMEPETNG